MRPLLRDRPLGPADPGAADGDPQFTALARRGDRGLHLIGFEHVRLGEARPVAELSGQRGALVGVQVGDRHRGAVGVQASGRRLAEPRGAADDERVRSLGSHRADHIHSVARTRRRLGSLRTIAPTAQANLSEQIAGRLAEARERTLLLVEPLADEQLNTVYSDILSPLAWDLGHIANFEELWLVQRVGGREPMDGDLGRFYDAIENPRKTRNELPILRGDELRAYMDEVRSRTFDVLESAELIDTDDELLRDGFIYEMLLAHEQQHNETMLQLLQMVDGYRPARVDGTVAGEPVSDGPQMVRIDAGDYEVGADAAGFAYDNERPRHAVELEAFEIDRTPVTNGAFAEFVADTGSEPPLYWEREGDGWVTTTFGHRRALDPDAPGRPRQLQRGARRSPAGPASGCRPSSNGRRRRAAPIRRAPTSTTSPLAARRPAPTRTPPRTAARCRCWATSGNGLPPTSPGIPASGPSRIPSTRRSSSATSTRCCAEAPGRPAAT